MSLQSKKKENQMEKQQNDTSKKANKEIIARSLNII